MSHLRFFNFKPESGVKSPGSYYRIIDKRIVRLEDRLKPFLNRKTLCNRGFATAPAEEYWTVPQSYWDEWRDWYGWTHRDAMAQCFEYGDLLVIGPSFHPSMNASRYLGRPCLYVEGRPATTKALWGEHSLVYSCWGKVISLHTKHLVPIQLCEPATEETWLLQQLQFRKV